MKPIGRIEGLTGWALVAALGAGFGAAHADGERAGARGPESGAKDRGAYERKESERRGPEGQGANEGRVVFLAGPVRSDADGKRLQDAIQAIKGVTRVTVLRNAQNGTARVLVISPDQNAFPRAFNAARSAGFSLQVAEVNSRPSGGDARGGRGFPDDAVLPNGKGRPEGDYRGEEKKRFEGDFRGAEKKRFEGDYRGGEKKRFEGDYRGEEKKRFEGDFRGAEKKRFEGDYRGEEKKRFEGDYPREGKERPGGKYSPEGESRPEKDFRPDGFRKGEASNPTLMVGPVRNNQEAMQLRQVLLRVEGVRGVVLKAGERPNTALVTLMATGQDAIKRATRVMQGYRLEVRPLKTAKEGGERREGDAKRPEGERRDGDRPKGEREF